MTLQWCLDRTVTGRAKSSGHPASQGAPGPVEFQH
jgi:hypothetical protein